MSKRVTFTSPKIAKEISRVFGSEVESFRVKIQHRRIVGEFVRKIENAHKRAKKSKMIFR